MPQDALDGVHCSTNFLFSLIPIGLRILVFLAQGGALAAPYWVGKVDKEGQAPYNASPVGAYLFLKERTCAKKDCDSFGKAFLLKKRFVLKEKQWGCFLAKVFACKKV